MTINMSEILHDGFAKTCKLENKCRYEYSNNMMAEKLLSLNLWYRNLSSIRTLNIMEHPSVEKSTLLLWQIRYDSKVSFILNREMYLSSLIKFTILGNVISLIRGYKQTFIVITFMRPD